MRANLTLASPTNKNEVLSGLAEIERYYKYRKDEYVPPIIEPLLFEELKLNTKSEVDYINLANTLLRPEQSLRKLKRKEELQMKYQLNSQELDNLDDMKQAELDAVDKNIDEAISNIEEKARLNGSGYSQSLSALISDLEIKRYIDKTKIEEKYIKKETELQALGSYYSDLISQVDTYYSETEKYESNAKVKELKIADEKAMIDCEKYNNSLYEKSTKYNNSLNQAEAELNLDYMKIVYEGMTEEELLLKGYYYDVVEWVMTYYATFSSTVSAYQEFQSTEEYIIYMKDYYAGCLELLYTRAYGRPSAMT